MNIRKNFRYGHGKVHTFQLDVFNVLNGNAIRTMTDTVGTSLGQVTAILPAVSRGSPTSSSGNGTSKLKVKSQS